MIIVLLFIANNNIVAVQTVIAAIPTSASHDGIIGIAFEIAAKTKESMNKT